MVPVPRGKIEALLDEVEAEPTDVNVAAAQQAYFRALSEATAMNARRQREGRSEDRARVRGGRAARSRKSSGRSDRDRSLRCAPCRGADGNSSFQACCRKVVHFEEHPAWLVGEELIEHNKEHNDTGKKKRKHNLVASNLPLVDWTSVFASERLTGAPLDRLTHHVHILEMNADSYRLKQSKGRKRRTTGEPATETTVDPEPAKSAPHNRRNEAEFNFWEGQVH